MTATSSSETASSAKSTSPGPVRRIGPGLITGAADDDPSGIATYSQAGAQAGFGLMWTLVLTWPLMVAVQSVSARIGRVTGRGLAFNMCRCFPRPVVFIAVAGLFAANAINIGADLSAMGAAVALLSGRGDVLFAAAFGLGSLLAIVFVPYHRYVGFLRWATLSLAAYVGVVFTTPIDWAGVAVGVAVPRLEFDRQTLTLLVALLGTTISPYLFFWQSSQEVEEVKADANAQPLVRSPRQAGRELTRIRWDTAIGMAASNLVGLFIILTTAATLHATGKTDIESTRQAAEALRPVAGEAAFLLFSLGILATGLLSVPILAASSAFAMGDVCGWKVGLEYKMRQAKRFYAVIAASILIGFAVLLLPIDPIKMLVWAAVVNGVIVVPIVAALMIVASRRDIMGRFVATWPQRLLGWATFVTMAAAAVALFVVL
ncbi:MAG: Nramp family divalent metal transporter [Alphaproteobacteria bacterium]|nr:Nramp family divalent metal transporter [Alphaproteobacteria bacterium]